MTDTMVRQYLASDAAREHYEKYGIGSSVDPREARITKLEAEVAKFEQHAKNYGVVVELMLADLLNLDRLYKKTLTERDMLAKRCAAQAHEIAELLSPPTVFSAIEVHQKQGVR